MAVLNMKKSSVPAFSYANNSLLIAWAIFAFSWGSHIRSSCLFWCRIDYEVVNLKCNFSWFIFQYFLPSNYTEALLGTKSISFLRNFVLDEECRLLGCGAV
jgi:hypothetical protein